jgi:hypothetical protein
MRLAARFTAYLLRNTKLDLESKNLLTNVLLEKIGALPLHDIITQDGNGRLLIHNRPVELEEARLLRESARGVLNNKAIAFVYEQVQFLAITAGIHKNIAQEDGLFAKAALWQGQEVINSLRTLAQIDAGDGID